MVAQRTGHRQRSAAKEQVWREVFAEQAISGQSVARFCRERGIQPSVFYFWRKELARRTTDQNTANPFAKDEMHFAEVEVTKSETVPNPSQPSTTPITIQLENDFRIEVPTGFDRETLRQVLTLLRNDFALRGESC